MLKRNLIVIGIICLGLALTSGVFGQNNKRKPAAKNAKVTKSKTTPGNSSQITSPRDSQSGMPTVRNRSNRDRSATIQNPNSQSAILPHIEQNSLKKTKPVQNSSAAGNNTPPKRENTRSRKRSKRKN